MGTDIKLITLLLLGSATVLVSGTLPIGMKVVVYLYFSDDYGNRVSASANLFDLETDTSESNYPNTVRFYLYTNERKYDPTQLFLGDVESLKLGKFDPKRRTVFITHGWFNDYTSPACTYVRDAFAKQGDYNLIVVDWGTLSKDDLYTVAGRVPKVAKFVAKMIDFLVSQGMNATDSIIVGHSFGAHVAGLSSYNAKHKLGFVVGLDPAQPGFTDNKPEKRLSKESGGLVQVIHTSNLLGLVDAVGHNDFYPNGGKDQPGCLLPQVCAHERAFMYFAESVINSTFTAHACDSMVKYGLGQCKTAASCSMGGVKPGCSSEGSYMLMTNKQPLFAKV